MRTTVLRRAATPLLTAAGVVLAALLAGASMAAEPQRNLQLQAVAPAAQHAQRLALVIGNAAYREAPLSNPVNDARAIAQALKAAGFTVSLHTDVDHRAMLGAVRDFGNRLRHGGVGVFYFAGHGMQIKGRNYLIPIGADIQREDEVAYAALDAQAVLDKMEAAANGSNVMILDACRNNPFARSFRSSIQGLAQMEAPVGSLVAFSTAPGSVASDGQGGNGLVTQHLLDAMRKPGAKVEDVFKQTRAAVRRDSQGKQVPWEVTSLEGDFYFVEPKPAPVPAAISVATAPHVPVPVPAPRPPPMPGTAPDAEELYWAVVKDSRHAGELLAYLGFYPQGKFSAAARARLAAIAHAPTVAVQQPVAPAATVLVPPASNYNAERDRRTEELRAELAASGRPESSVPAPVAARPSAAATPGSPRRNAQGYTVGDKWNYQVIDKWKGEVIRNYALQVGKILPDGGWVTPRGGAEFDEHGRWKKLLRADGERWQSVPFAPRWWPDMKVGETRRFQYRQTGTPVTGNGWVNDVDLEGRVMGIETIKVPAGEFRAYRVEFKGNSTAVGRSGVGRSTLTYWYAPELHTLVAYEGESTWNGRLDVREREELTSYVLVNPPAPR